METTKNGTQPSRKGPAEWFTGTVRIDSPFQAAEPARIGGAVVTFEPGEPSLVSKCSRMRRRGLRRSSSFAPIMSSAHLCNMLNREPRQDSNQ